MTPPVSTYCEGMKMNDISKTLTDDLNKALAGRADGGLKGSVQPDAGRTTADTAGKPMRVSDRIDRLIGDLQMRIDILQKLKESL